MSEQNWLAERFEENRGHLRGVAYRILGSSTEADDAVQETWLRLNRSDASTIENLGGWLTTVVARVCLDMLRSRKSRREDGLEVQPLQVIAQQETQTNPEQEAVLADSVGLALMVVLDRLAPAERLAFVLHDLFAVPFEEIAAIVGRSPEATRQLASRARRRVQGASAVPNAAVNQQRKVVDAFLSALRTRDFDALLAVLDPDLVVRVDETAALEGAPREVRGARNWAKGAITFSQMVRSVQPALVNGSVGVVWAPHGHLFRVLSFQIEQGKIKSIDIVGDPVRMQDLELAVLEEDEAPAGD